MAQMKVFNPSNVLKAIEASRAKSADKAQDVYALEMKKAPEGKTYKCEFFKQTFKVGDDKPSPAILRLGDETAYSKHAASTDPAAYPKESYIEITEGVFDPDAPENDERKDYGQTITTNEERSGDFGKLMVELDAEYTKTIKSWKTPAKEGEAPKVDPDAKLHPIVQSKYSMKTKAVDKDKKSLKGMPLKSKKIRMDVDFEKYKDDHPNKLLRGKAKTEIFDFRTQYLDANKKVQYKAATVVDPDTGVSEPVTKDNVHKFLRRGSRIVGGRFHMEYGTVSGFGIASAKLAGRLIVDNRFVKEDVEEGTSEITDPELIAMLAASSSAPADPAVVKPADPVVNPDPAGVKPADPVVVKPADPVVNPTAATPAADPVTAGNASIDDVLAGFNKQ